MLPLMLAPTVPTFKIGVLVLLLAGCHQLKSLVTLPALLTKLTALVLAHFDPSLAKNIVCGAGNANVPVSLVPLVAKNVLPLSTLPTAALPSNTNVPVNLLEALFE